MKINSLLAGTMALVLVAGIVTPAFADIVSGVDETQSGPLNTQSVLGPEQVGSDIDFVFTGTGSGSLGQTNFVNADYTITVWADTADVFGGPTIFNVKGIAAQVEIDGVGTAAVTGDFGVFTNDGGSGAIGFQLFVGNNPSSDYHNLVLVAVNGYDLTTDFGPVLGTPLNANNNFIPTDAGNFVLQNGGFTGSGSFTAQLKGPVGGELLPIDSTALILAGAQTNAVWIMSALAVIGSVAFGALYITSKKN